MTVHLALSFNLLIKIRILKRTWVMLLKRCCLRFYEFKRTVDMNFLLHNVNKNYVIAVSSFAPLNGLHFTRRSKIQNRSVRLNQSNSIVFPNTNMEHVVQISNKFIVLFESVGRDGCGVNLGKN